MFNAKDKAWSEMELWQDLNHDGRSQRSELFSLADKGVVETRLEPTGREGKLDDGTRVLRSTFVRNV